MHRLIQPIPRLGRIACRMLCIELPLVLLAAVVLLISYLAAAEADPVLAALRFGEAPVTVFASLVLSVCTSLLCDLAERRNGC